MPRSNLSKQMKFQLAVLKTLEERKGPLNSSEVGEALRVRDPELTKGSPEAYSRKVERALGWGYKQGYIKKLQPKTGRIQYQIRKMPKADRELTYDELIALVVAELQLELLGGTRVGESFRDLVGWIRETLSNEPKQQLELIRGFVRLRGRPRLRPAVAYQPGFFARILKACAEKGMLEVSYKAAREGSRAEPKKKLVQAHFLTISEDGLYLTGMTPGADGGAAPIHLALPRIVSVEIPSEPKQGALDDLKEKHLDQLFGIQLPDQAETRAEEIKLCFDRDLAPFICERKWPGQQGEATRNQDGSATIHLKLKLTKDLVRWVLGWGSRVKILEGDSLRKRVIEEAKGLLSQY